MYLGPYDPPSLTIYTDMAVVNHTIELMHTPIMSQYWHTKP
jgi:hypothetical protein